MRVHRPSLGRSWRRRHGPPSMARSGSGNPAPELDQAEDAEAATLKGPRRIQDASRSPGLCGGIGEGDQEIPVLLRGKMRARRGRTPRGRRAGSGGRDVIP